jgi:glycosyltransferase involved in cell wall biosynthesis
MSVVLQINIVTNYGSTGHIVEEIGQLTMACGWKSYIAYGRYERQSKSVLIKIGTDWDMKIHVLQTRLFDKHGLSSVNPTKKLINKIKEIKPDIIHLHNIHGYYINYKILFDYLSIADIPVVWTLHDCWAITGHCAYFDYISCNKWKIQCHSCQLIKEYPASFFVDRSKSNYLQKKELFTSVNNITLVPVSNWLEKILKNSFLSDCSIQVINNGINLNIFTPKIGNIIYTKYNLTNTFIILGVANVWDARKGLNDFFKLSQILQEGFKIVLVGLSQNQINVLPENIIGLPRTENVEQLAELYSSADLFVNPTWEDNFPTTNLEALACGTPVLTYKTGGSPESITLETGFILEQGDIDGILNVVKEVQTKGKSYYNKACRERAVSFYDKDQKYQEYIELYNSLVKNNQNKYHV